MITSWILLATLPPISALIGWGTNRLAIHMLFHPRRERRFLGISIQGLIPRRHQEIALRSGEIVARELVQGHHLRDQIEKIDLQPILDETVTVLVWDRLGPRLKAIPFIGSMVNDSLLAKLHTLAAEEMTREAPKLKARVAAHAETQIDIQRMVQERVDAFELNKLEEVVRNLAGREFRQIEYLGAAVGLAIGFAQVGLVLLSNAL